MSATAELIYTKQKLGGYRIRFIQLQQQSTRKLSFECQQTKNDFHAKQSFAMMAN